MIKNNNATIFIYVLILIGIVLVVSLIVMNNSISLQNALEYQKLRSKDFLKLQEKAEINAIKDRYLSLDGTGFTDIISCPDNLTMSGDSLKESGMILTWAYDGSSYVCSGTYNNQVINLYLNPTYTSFSQANWGNQTINLVSDGSGNLSGQANFIYDNTIIDIPAGSYQKTDLIDDDHRNNP